MGLGGGLPLDMCHARPPVCGFALMSQAMGKKCRCLVAALWEETLRESTLTENYLVLPGQVLQPEAKGGVTPTENLGS